MSDVQTRPVTFAAAVIARPKMYTLNGTFGEVISFLEGYMSGIAKGNCDAPPLIEWNDFEEWLTSILGVRGRDAFQRIQDSHADNCEQLKALADLYDRFQSDRI